MSQTQQNIYTGYWYTPWNCGYSSSELTVHRQLNTQATTLITDILPVIFLFLITFDYADHWCTEKYGVY